jgi:quercetin dioxygenase-like cupin family protein
MIQRRITMVDMTSATAVPVMNELDDNDYRWFLGLKTWIRSTAAETGGGLGIVEELIPPGFASPYHVHHAEDESFYIIDGSVRFISGDNSWLAGPGSFVFLPRDIPHGFQVEGDETARVLFFMTPAGFEQFVDELCESDPPAGPPDIAQVIQVAAKYDVDILGPLPTQR